MLSRRSAPGRRAAWHTLYDALALPSVRTLLPAAATLDRKVAAFRRDRRAWTDRLRRDLDARPDLAAGSALWVHAASAGELLQARALLAALRTVRPDAPLVSTYTSPSGAAFAKQIDADLLFPLPLDTRENARTWLEMLRPAALALVDAELWPNYLSETHRFGAPAVLLSGRLEVGSRRRLRAMRRVYRDLYALLDLIGCVDEKSAELFRADGAPSARVRVTGDLRVDETLRRAEETPREWMLPLPALAPVVVAGSTWPADEALLLPALAELRDRGVFFTLAIAPHDVSAERLLDLESSLFRVGFTAARWSRVEGADVATAGHDSVLVDRLGLLYRLYANAAVAYVGGGFGSGLHNVMEPAAFGVPIVTGPRLRRSWLAPQLMERCGLFPTADRASCVTVLERLMRDETARRSSGEAARAVVEAHAGAASRTLAELSRVGWLERGS